MHPFDIVGTRYAIGDVPAALDDPIVRGDIVADERKHRHDDMLGDAVTIAVGHFRNRYAAVHGSLQIGVIRTDACGYDHLQLRSLRDALGMPG